MKNLWNNYKGTILLLIGIIVGGVLGAVCPQSAVVLRPIGDIFMNLLFVLIVPMVLLSVSSSICNLSGRSALGQTLGSAGVMMCLIMVLMAVLTYFGVLIYPPVDGVVPEGMAVSTVENREVGDLIVDALTVQDFGMLFSVRHILPLMVVAALMGWTVSKMRNEHIIKGLQTGSDLVMKMMDTLMIFAPLGLGCYFAGLMAQGSMSLFADYARTLILYLVLTAVVYGVIFPLIAMVLMRKHGGMKTYWKAMLQPSLMAVSTLSSSASMPANIASAKQMGADDEIADSVVPLGTQLYKVGSVLSGVMKVGFTMLLCGQAIDTPQAALLMIGVGLLSSVVVGAVPTGAGTAELLICSILGAEPKMVGVLLITSTIIDMPATLLNVSGNTLLPVMVDRWVKRRSK